MQKESRSQRLTESPVHLGAEDGLDASKQMKGDMRRQQPNNSADPSCSSCSLNHFALLATARLVLFASHLSSSLSSSLAASLSVCSSFLSLSRARFLSNSHICPVSPFFIAAGLHAGNLTPSLLFSAPFARFAGPH
uniref:Uncharacterized protein n=1 Tax=Toxoplasma gondii COUG TaxID=1074873 RepID=A0A2G8XQY4_TOXGO|nr:hypothetical protein TGCOUG_395180 [Toxoplasma gondii COUG]